MLESIEEMWENAKEFDAKEDVYTFLYKMRIEYKRLEQEELKARQEWGIFS